MQTSTRGLGHITPYLKNMFVLEDYKPHNFKTRLVGNVVFIATISVALKIKILPKHISLCQVSTHSQ